jgi:homoserine O-acetyltransferase
MNIQRKKALFDEPLYLESGRVLSSYEIAYETYGVLNDDKSNVVVVCHALTGSQHCAGTYDTDRKAGWWDKLIGTNKAVDTTKDFVICMNNLGSCFGSTSPLSINKDTKQQYRLKFPVLTISDIVKAQINTLHSLDIFNVKAVVGGSLGGMQALCYAIEYPSFAKDIIMIASTAYTRPWAIAFNKIAVEAIRNDKDFKDGYYDEKEIQTNGLTGMAYGRMAGHISFLSPNSMDKKFGRNYVNQDGLYELFGRFEVERYLEYNGYNFTTTFDPLSYLYIVKTMNIFNASRGNDTLEESLNKIETNLHLKSFENDILFKPFEMKEIYDILCNLGKKDIVTYTNIQSTYGHDAFLVEVDKFEEQIKDILT